MKRYPTQRTFALRWKNASSDRYLTRPVNIFAILTRCGFHTTMNFFEGLIGSCSQPECDSSGDTQTVEWHNGFGTGPDFSELALGDQDMSSSAYDWSTSTAFE